MICTDPGHSYDLSTLDGDGTPVHVDFVKREGDKFPGNAGHHPGTTLQETWRMGIDRLRYLDKQDPSPYNQKAILGLESAIIALEDRAAERHSRPYNGTWDNCYGPQCPKCLHVGCEGQCH